MRILSNSLISLILLVLFFGFGLSQNKTSTKQEHILIAIGDSQRGRNFFGEDSTWLNEQLQLYNAPSRESKIKYKLVKIGKRDFTEGPNPSSPFGKKEPIANYKYGDSTYSVLGQKFYTYVGNSSWGYYPEYILHRIYPIPTLKFIPRDPNTCEHGWDMRRGQACYQCLDNYRMKHDSNYKKIHTLKLNLIDSSRYCKHSYDGHLGNACPQCRNEDKIKNDSIKKMIINPRIQDCAHGHICCDVSWCDCCPNKRKIKPQQISKK